MFVSPVLGTVRRPSHIPPSKSQLGQEVRCEVVFSRDITNGELIGLHGEVPVCYSGIGIPHFVHPLQRSMIHIQGEFSAQKIVPERVQGPFHGQTLFLHGEVADLPRKQLPADVCYWMPVGVPCRRTAPTPRSEASLCTINVALKSGLYSTGFSLKALMSSKAARVSSIHLILVGWTFCVKSVRRAVLCE